MENFFSSLRHILDVDKEAGILTLLAAPVICATLLVATFMMDMGLIQSTNSQEEVYTRSQRFLNERIQGVSKDYIFTVSDYRDGVSESRLVVRVARDLATLRAPWSFVAEVVFIMFSSSLAIILCTIYVMIKAEPDVLKGISAQISPSIIARGIRIFSGVFIAAMIVFSLYFCYKLNFLTQILVLFGK